MFTKPELWWLCLDGDSVLGGGLVSFFFFFIRSTVVSTCAQYLYQITGLMSCSLPVLGGLKFCLFILFAVVRLAYLL